VGRITSFHRHALRQVPRLIDVRAAADEDVVRHQLRPLGRAFGRILTGERDWTVLAGLPSELAAAVAGLLVRQRPAGNT
jgi:hypothetical protein